MLFLTPSNFSDYELIDSGHFKKLERFGNTIVSRPEPQAIWDPHLSDAEWEKRASALFKKEKSHDLEGEIGEWALKKGMQQQWIINYKNKALDIKFRLGLSAFKHVGIFPEQAPNWDYIFTKTKALNLPKPKVLNLFAYTGGASLAAKAAGADVTHVDSSRPAVSWARENMEASQLTDIRWVVEDALKFVQREVKRGNQYQGIILDPPAYGRGPNGEKWVVEDLLNEFLKNCKQLLDPKDHFFILNLYSNGYSVLVVETLLKKIFGKINSPELGELFLQDQYGKKLPLGRFGRFSSI